MFTVNPDITIEQIAWVAGFIEGEGCFSVKWHTLKDGTRRGRPQVVVQSCDHDVIARLHSWLGAGTLNGPYSRGVNKPVYRWVAMRLDDVQQIVKMTLPYLGERRTAAALKMLTDSGLTP